MNEMNSKSLYNIIKQTHSKTNIWNYYGRQNLSDIDIFDHTKSRCFIYSFFSNSGKSNIYNMIEEIEKIDDNRFQHIIFVFFLGLSIYETSEHIKSSLDQTINRYKKDYKIKSNVNFVFIWFLCCLFHDLGYGKEEMTEDISWNLKKGALKYTTSIPSFYKGTITPYLNYIKKRFGHIDHGIYGGIILYESLKRIRKDKEQKQHSNINNKNSAFKLSWEKELLNIYRIASNIVMCHNIWMVKENSLDASKLYKGKLKQLIYKEGEYKIRFNVYPLFFFFCLIDSIEPIKVVKEISYLKQIMIEVTDSYIKIKSEMECGCHENYLNKIRGIGNWLTPVIYNKKEGVTIYIEN